MALSPLTFLGDRLSTHVKNPGKVYIGDTWTISIEDDLSIDAAGFRGDVWRRVCLSWHGGGPPRKWGNGPINYVEILEARRVFFPPAVEVIVLFARGDGQSVSLLWNKTRRLIPPEMGSEEGPSLAPG
jgi:hypothetical protein